MAEGTLDQIDHEMLELTRSARVKIINELMKPGQAVPKGESEQITLMSAIDGLDKHVFSKAKLKLEEKDSFNKEEVIRLMAATLSELNVKKIHESRKDGGGTVLPVDIKVDVVPGETDIGVIPIKPEDVQQ